MAGEISATAAPPALDMNKKCVKFVEEGYCEVNPGYMRKYCATSYHIWEVQKNVRDFYSIVEKDIYGQEVSFEIFRGKYVYMVNVASEDGNSYDNYNELQLLSSLRSDIFEIAIFPCNQFGHKEPRSDSEIVVFARQHGYRGIIMSKGDVNGVNTRPAFQYLKSNSDLTHVNGNFEGRYLLNPSGNVMAFHPHVVAYDEISSILRSTSIEL